MRRVGGGGRSWLANTYKSRCCIFFLFSKADAYELVSTLCSTVYTLYLESFRHLSGGGGLTGILYLESSRHLSELGLMGVNQ